MKIYIWINPHHALVCVVEDGVVTSSTSPVWVGKPEGEVLLAGPILRYELPSQVGNSGHSADGYPRRIEIEVEDFGDYGFKTRIVQ